MNRAKRRIGMYFHSLPESSSPSMVRAPQLTTLPLGSTRMQLTPSLLSTPFWASVSTTLRPLTVLIPASTPAGAFQTPRLASVRAIRPAIAPPAPITRVSPATRMCSRG